MGHLSLVAGHPATALVDLARARQGGLDDPTMLGWVAEAKWRTGDLDGGRQELADALAAAPTDPALLKLQLMIR